MLRGQTRVLLLAVLLAQEASSATVDYSPGTGLLEGISGDGRVTEYLVNTSFPYKQGGTLNDEG